MPAAVDDGDDEDRRDERSLQEPHERAAAAVLSPRRRRRLSRHGARELIELTMSVCSLCRLCDIWVSNSGSRSTTTSRKRSHKEEAEWRTGRVGCCEVVDGDDTIRHVVVAGGFSRGKKKLWRLENARERWEPGIDDRGIMWRTAEEPSVLSVSVGIGVDCSLHAVALLTCDSAEDVDGFVWCCGRMSCTNKIDESEA